MPWISGKRGAYRVMWRTGGRGSEVKASETFKDKTDASARLREIQATTAERRSLTTQALGSTPLTTLLLRWQASRLAGQRARKPYTIEAMAHVQGMIDEMEWKRVGDITAESIDRWRSKRENGKGTDKPLQCVKAFLRWCKRSLKLRVDDWALEVEARRVPHRKSPPLLSDEQVAGILARALTFGLSFGTMIEHLLLYGCRPIDVCRMRVGDWDRKTRRTTYRETKNLDDVVHLTHEQHAARLDQITKGRDPQEFLFLNRFNKPWYITEIGQAEGLTSWYKNNIAEWVVSKVKGPDGKWIKSRFLPPGQRGIYCLKDYAITRMGIAANGDRRAVVAISGHKTLSVVDRYMSTNEATQRRLIDAITAL